MLEVPMALHQRWWIGGLTLLLVAASAIAALTLLAATAAKASESRTNCKPSQLARGLCRDTQVFLGSAAPELALAPTPNGQVAAIRGVSGNTCTILSIAFGNAAFIDALIGCANLEDQDRVQALVRCFRGSDSDDDGVVECLDPGEFPLLQPSPEDFDVIDLDADQVHATGRYAVLAFVDGDYAVEFTTDRGEFITSGVLSGAQYTCDMAFEDPDCDGDPATVGDGVVVALIWIGEADPRGPGLATASQNGVGMSQPFVVTGPPDRIELTLADGKDTIHTGAESCPFTTDVDAVTGQSQETMILVRAYDTDDVPITGTLIAFTFPFQSTDLNFYPESAIAGVASRQVATWELGALGSGGLNPVCGKSEGVFTTTATFETIFDPLANTAAEDTVEITVSDEPTPTGTATATNTPTSTSTPAATRSREREDRDTRTPTTTLSPNTPTAAPPQNTATAVSTVLPAQQRPPGAIIVPNTGTGASTGSGGRRTVGAMMAGMAGAGVLVLGGAWAAWIRRRR